MKLYDFPFSPNCRKVRAVAYEVGAPLEHVYVDLLAGGSRTPEFLARNPNGRVPVLEDGELTLWESVAIMRYLAAGTTLVPTARRAAAEVDRWLAWQLAHLGPSMSKVGFEVVVKPLRKLGPPDVAIVELGRTEFYAAAAVLERELTGREYLAGPLTLADFAVAAHLSIAPACGLELTRFTAVESWLARMHACDSIKRALAEARVLQ